MKNLFQILFLILCITVVIQTDNYTLVLLPQERGAACLDGSPVGLYINEGKGQNKDSFLIYFNSGGFCGAGGLNDTLESCYKRSNGGLGSTKNAKQSVNADHGGLLSTDPQLNPVFYDWTKVFAIYCDGAEYFGSRPDPIPYKDKKLYFRGTNNVLEQVKYLEDKYDIFRKNKIVITGVSAGGIATYLYSNHFLAKTVTAKIYSIPDSGLFLTDYYSPLAKEKVIPQVSRALLDIVWSQQQYPIEDCLRDFKNDTVQCFNAANLIKYIKTPMLIIQSPYDEWSLSNLLRVDCLSNNKAPFSIQSCNDTVIKVINDYRDASREALLSMIKTKPKTGVWSPSCVQHGYTDSPSFNSDNYRIPSGTGKSIPETIKEFLDNPDKPPVVIDSVNWPDNKGCNGLSNSINLRQIFSDD